jgi:DNA primase
VERELYIDRVAKLLSISNLSLQDEVKKALRSRNKAETGAFEKKMQNKSLGIGDKINPEYSLNPKAASAEEAILGIIMLFPERAADVFGGKARISESDFITSFNKRVFAALKKEFEAGNSDVSVLGAEFTPDEMSRIYEMRMKRQGLDSASPTVLSDNVAALKSAAAARETDIDKLIKAKLAENN